jgi:hypothetical protein
MSTPNSAAFPDGGFSRAPSHMVPRAQPGPRKSLELEFAAPAPQLAESFAVFAAMAQGGVLSGLRVNGRLVFTESGSP